MHILTCSLLMHDVDLNKILFCHTLYL
ncbi:unnamed protein product [Spodoptera littoralis]|uniref:Uncharacterized protein n=1 Tax=Spodoptera littoralis TaxID=7109 RepID=A0A9P0HY94_SPOLI|nr:unnamed protein product [Spodoptera littoralis]CAH1636408.1 unnamed protein product [Spodoptera littoralis]